QSDLTSFVVVTSPTEESVAEAVYFAQRLNEAKLPFGAVVVNRVHPKYGDGIGARSRQISKLRAQQGDCALLADLLDNENAFMRVVRREELNLRALASKVPRHRWVRVPYLEQEAVDFRGLVAISDQLFDSG
ncbi:MAG TPA: hypothetical protein VFF07_05865, partial [Actinomycetota bacterium]|nr:hypothetical protein [Actinomycetota bacterium]